ncbi:zinc finger, CCHC-type containing protein [Tanacetum coccineum]|uniref:Zinc finger, CCHC-type containing protein n=1 Tax=Tanacetum coccineum TaxID=301880 RepID=A0ABQ5BDL7_9ASTR
MTIESRDAIFDENRFSSIPRPKDIIPNSDKSQRDDHSDDVPSEIPEPRKGIKRSRSQYSYCYIDEDPRTYNEAMQSRDSAFWKEAIDDEIGSIMENNTWILSDLPPGCKLLGCKWIFKRKMKVDGTIDKFKARLVIQGFRHKEGIDYFDTYAPVACITTIRLLLALAAIHNLVCKLVKSLYGLKQAPKQWHQKFDEVVLSSVDKTKKFLSSSFSMKDMGEAYVILGIKIKRENKEIVITQSHYIEKILQKFNREDFSSVSTPIDLVEKLKPNTEPDIDLCSGSLSRFTSNPSRQHWQAITRVFKYLKGTMNYGLSYVGYPLVLEAYSDASWINHVEDSSSTSGWVFLLRGGVISWASKKQTCITGSTMESEFVALAAAGKEAEWLRNLIHEIPIWPKPIAPISIRYTTVFSSKIIPREDLEASSGIYKVEILYTKSELNTILVRYPGSSQTLPISNIKGVVVPYEVVAKEIVAEETVDGDDVEQVVLNYVISHEVYAEMVAQEMLKDQTRAIKRRRVMTAKEDKENAV